MTPVNRLNTQPENNLHHALGHYQLHLGLDLTTGEIICSDLTLDHVGDSTALPGLLDQFDGPVRDFWRMGPMTAPRPEICSRRVLAMQSRSSFHRQKTPFSP